jgi:hypothetical protein
VVRVVSENVVVCLWFVIAIVVCVCVCLCVCVLCYKYTLKKHVHEICTLHRFVYFAHQVTRRHIHKHTHSHKRRKKLRAEFAWYINRYLLIYNKKATHPKPNIRLILTSRQQSGQVDNIILNGKNRVV